MPRSGLSFKCFSRSFIFCKGCLRSRFHSMAFILRSRWASTGYISTTGDAERSTCRGNALCEDGGRARRGQSDDGLQRVLPARTSSRPRCARRSSPPRPSSATPGPDPAARTLARGSTGTVGILFHGTPRYALSDDFAAPVPRGHRRGAGPRRAGAHPAAQPRARGTSLPVRDVAMDGAIIYSCSPADEQRRVAAAQAACRSCSSTSRRTTASRSVNVDDRAGARAAAAHLVELGHRRIALLAAGPEALANPDDWYVPRERLRGWRDALEPAGIAPVAAVRREDRGRAAGSPRPGRCSPGPSGRPRCSAFSDALAADVLRAADDLRLRVPADLSVIGFDDSPLARRVTPALTTVRAGRGREGHARRPRSWWRRCAGAPGRPRGAGPAPAAAHRAGAARDDGAARRRRAGNERHLRRLGPYEGADRPVSGGGRTRGGWRRSRRDAARLPTSPASSKKVTSSGPRDKPARCSTRAIANSTAATMAVMTSSSKRWCRRVSAAGLAQASDRQRNDVRIARTGTRRRASPHGR